MALEFGVWSMFSITGKSLPETPLGMTVWSGCPKMRSQILKFLRFLFANAQLDCFMILYLETSLSEWAESFPNTHFGQFDCSLLLLSFPIDVEFSFPLVIRILNQTFSSSVMTFIRSIWSFLLPAPLVSSRGKISFNISQPPPFLPLTFCWEIRRNLWQPLGFPTFTFLLFPQPTPPVNATACNVALLISVTLLLRQKVFSSFSQPGTYPFAILICLKCSELEFWWKHYCANF